MTVVIGNGVGTSSKVKKYTARSLAEYIDRLGHIRIINDLCFRGLSKNTYQLRPSIDRRIDSNTPSEKWLELEYNLVEFSEQRFPDTFVKQTPALLLANMQHYGIPTRMMDVTGNALVALYFACAKEEEVDGQVIVFDEKTVSAYNPYVNIIADTYRITQNVVRFDLEKYRYAIYNQSYCSSLIYPEWEKGDEIIDNTNIELVKRPLIVDVGAVNQRQINQSGKFVIFPNEFKIGKNGKEYISNQLFKIEKDSNFIKAIIEIPSGNKKRIIDSLRLAGITEDFLFPDNTDAVCQSIKMSVAKKLYNPFIYK